MWNAVAFAWLKMSNGARHAGQYVVAQVILTEAYNMARGLMAWAEAGLPLETGAFSSYALPPRASNRMYGTISGIN